MESEEPGGLSLRALGFVPYFTAGVLGTYSLVMSFLFFFPGAVSLRSQEYGGPIPPDTLTCVQSNCYDRSSQFGPPGSCTPGTGQLVRGYRIPAGKQTCYKSVFYNLERNTALCLSILAAFCVTVARAIEYLLPLVIQCSVRWSILLAIVCNFFPLYYSCVDSRDVPAYFNEKELTLPKVFFTVTELATTLILLSQSDAKGAVNQLLMNIVGGISLMHAVQMLSDERFELGARNIVLLQGDLAYLAADLFNTKAFDRRQWTVRITAAVFASLVFQLFFADQNSFSALRG